MASPEQIEFAISETPASRLLQAFGERPLLIEASRMDSGSGRDRCYAVVDGIAVIDVVGILSNKNPYWSSSTSYSALLADVTSAVEDSSVAGIILRVDSPGGDTNMAFETADAIASMKRSKPMFAAIDSGAYSAAYLIASQSDKIYIPPKTGGAGSIGVYTMHIDYSEALTKAGVKVTYISEGEGKVDGNPYEPLSKTASEELKALVAKDYGYFVDAVSRGRGLSADAIHALGARLYFGSDAITAGLADKLGTFQTALDVMRAKTSKPAAYSFAANSQQGANMADTNENANGTAAAVAAPSTEAIRAAAQAEAAASVAEIADLCAIAGKPELLAGFIRSGSTPASVRASLAKVKADASDSNPTNSTIRPEAGLTGASSEAGMSLAEHMTNMLGLKS